MARSANREVFLLALMLVLVFPSILTAAAVEHHGVSADSDNSRECIGCHDGTIGSNVSFYTSGGSALTEHPVFTPYNAGNRRTRLQPSFLAASRGIRFEDGEVTCISCHDIRNSRENHLIMDNGGSRLCLACHIK